MTILTLIRMLATLVLAVTFETAVLSGKERRQRRHVALFWLVAMTSGAILSLVLILKLARLL